MIFAWNPVTQAVAAAAGGMIVGSAVGYWAGKRSKSLAESAKPETAKPAPAKPAAKESTGDYGYSN